MHLSNIEIKRIARAQLNGQYRLPVLSDLLVSLLPALLLLPFSSLLADTSSLLSTILYDLATLLILVLSVVLSTGRMYLQLNLSRRKAYGFGDLIHCFKVRPDSYILAFLLCVVYALPYVAADIGFPILAASFPELQSGQWPFVFFLLRVILLLVSVCLLLNYVLVFLLLLDDPEKKIRAVFEESRRLMNGSKKRFILLLLSFLGYALLCLLSLGIGFLWVNPYLVQSVIVFYLDLTGELSNAPAKGSASQSSLAQP